MTRVKKPLDKYKDILFLNFGYPLSKNKLFDINKEYKLRCNLPIDFTLHGWRHTGITHITKKQLKKKGNNKPLTLKILQAQTGHKDVNVLEERYINICSEEIKEFYDDIWEENNNKDKEEVEPEKDKPTPKKPTKPQDNYIASDNIRIKELELELLKLKEKQSKDDDDMLYQ
jgi:hypothetical protein